MAEEISTRIAYGKALEEFGDREDVIVLDADLKSCTMTTYFARRYPERFINMGIAEANMADVAAGMAACGAVPVINSFSMFATGRIYDQVRNSIAYPGLNVKIVGSHAGVTVGEDGATHQCIEDISLMRTIPGMTVVVPCDGNETREATRAILEHPGPCYLRTGRCAVKTVTADYGDYRFRIGTGVLLEDGTDVTLIACGLMVQKALEACQTLKGEGISARVIDMHTIKPIDKEMILRAAKETGAIVTAEEHNVIGGLGAAVAEVVAVNHAVPMEIIGMQDCFGHSGHPEELLVHYGLTADAIVKAAKRAMARKNSRAT